MTLSAGSVLGRYRVLGKLGEGGMGEVYRATDTTLGRDVAVKVLPAAMAQDPERLARFQREARAIAALNHPHIVTLHSVEEADGIHFLTMELVEGQALDRIIPAQGWPVDQIVRVAGALAEALTAAHDRGIVHRDLKPANVMMTGDGRVKMLDFGIAKETSAPELDGLTMTSAGQTQDGVVMGTPAYMSPEQISGRAIDHRTDLFSLGVLMYEMATGRRPFQGESSAELASAILRDSPPAVTEVRADLPADLARVIRRCLAKDPRDRLQTARDVAAELRDLVAHAPATVTAAVGPARPTTSPGSGAARQDEGFWVAVLPFKYSGGSADMTALAEGLSEEIVTGLSRFSYLRVVARDTTARYAGDAADAHRAGKEIGARYVMSGSIRQAGARVRIAVQLVDALSGAHLWAETYERAFSPEALFELQDDLVPRIVSTVADWYGVLPRSMSEVIRSKPAAELSPYEALLRAYGYYERVSLDEHAVTRAALERAVEQAPGSADGWAMLSMLYGEEFRFRFNERPDPLGRALHAAKRAVDASASNHAAHLALAQALFFRKEFGAFRSAAERAIALNPMDGATVEYLAHLIAFSGDWDRGCDLAERARQLNPHHPAWYGSVPILNAYRHGDYAGARAWLLKGIMGNSLSQAMAAAIHAQLGDRSAATASLSALLLQEPDYAGVARDELSKWYLPDLVDALLDGLRKAGLALR